MQPGQQVAIGLHDKAAKLFLGLDERHPTSRWVAVGAILPLPHPPIGVRITKPAPAPGRGCQAERAGGAPPARATIVFHAPVASLSARRMRSRFASLFACAR